MINPTYTINISYIEGRHDSNYLTYINGVTSSVYNYSPSYFQATMQQVDISATGSTYTEALSKLLIIATSSNTDYTGFSLNSIRTW